MRIPDRSPRSRAWWSLPSFVQVAAALLLFAMMFAVGLELTTNDFRRVLAAPRAVIVGTFGQLVLLPVVTLAGLMVLDLSPRIAAGVVLILAAPGGGISNVFALLAGANIALSVSLTATASLLAVVTLPILTTIGFGAVVEQEAAMSVPIVPMIGQLVVLMLVPIALGMRVRARRADWAAERGPLVRRLVLGGAIVVIVIGATSDTTGLLGDAFDALWVGLAWTVTAMIVGYSLGVACGLEAADRFTVALELAVKNVGLAAIVAISTLDRPELAVFAGAYVVTGYPLAILAALGFRRMQSGVRNRAEVATRG